MQDSITTQLVVTVRTLDFCGFFLFYFILFYFLFFIFYNSELKENKKNMKKKINIQGNEQILAES